MRLRQVLTEYLTERGWYQDPAETGWPGEGSGEVADSDWGWTVPEWENYWRARDGTMSRRHENFKEAVWTQLMREEDPETFEPFFADTRHLSEQ